MKRWHVIAIIAAIAILGNVVYHQRETIIDQNETIDMLLKNQQQKNCNSVFNTKKMT